MLSENKGFTIVEVLIAMSLLSIVAIAFITMMTFSVSSILVAGEKSEQMFEAKGEIEKKISAQTPSGYDQVNIHFPNEVNDLTIKGEKLEINYEYDGKAGSITYFLPKKEE